ASSAVREDGTIHGSRGDKPDASIADVGTTAVGTEGRYRRRKRGRRRKQVRLPFLKAADDYLNSRRAYYGENTLRQRKRDLHLIARDLSTLRNRGLVTARAPGKLSADEIANLV